MKMSMWLFGYSFVLLLSFVVFLLNYPERNKGQIAKAQ